MRLADGGTHAAVEAFAKYADGELARLSQDVFVELHRGLQNVDDKRLERQLTAALDDLEERERKGLRSRCHGMPPELGNQIGLTRGDRIKDVTNMDARH